jgi:flagellar protein FliS
MLYDGAISAMQQAKEAITAGHIEARFNLLTKATNILMGLQSSLDFEAGEQVSAVLYDYYSNLLFRINQLHRTRDLAQCDGVIEDLKSMRGLWDEIDRQERAEQAPIPVEPAPESPVSEASEPSPSPVGGLSVSA